MYRPVPTSAPRRHRHRARPGRAPGLPAPARPADAWSRAIADERRIRPDVPATLPQELTGWLESLLAPDPSRRPTAREALKRLQTVASAADCALPPEPDTPTAAVASPVPVRADPTRQRLQALYEMSRALNSESDPEALLASILDMALDVVSAERGMKMRTGTPVAGGSSVRPSRLRMRSMRSSMKPMRSSATVFRYSSG